MAIKVISLRDLIKTGREDEIENLLLSFKTINVYGDSGAADVEYFLHNRAIEFEKHDISRTYLVMSSYQKEPCLVGYFSIAQKPLIIPKKYFDRLSKSARKRLMGIGYKNDQSTYEIKSFLLGQLGRNYDENIYRNINITGDDLLHLAYDKIIQAYELVGGRILYLECEDNSKIIDFYRKNGFALIEKYKTKNNLCIMIKRISDNM